MVFLANKCGNDNKLVNEDQKDHKHGENQDMIMNVIRMNPNPINNDKEHQHLQHKFLNTMKTKRIRTVVKGAQKIIYG